MKTILQKISSLILSVILICFTLPIRAAASYEIPGVCLVQTDMGGTCIVKTLDYAYNDNTYFSLRDIAMLLKDTDKSFALDITDNAVSLHPGYVYMPVGAENDSWENDENPNISLRRNEFKIYDDTVFYYTLIMKLPSGDYDCFMMAADLAMILDVNITIPEEGSLKIHTQEPFGVSPFSLEEAGYFYGVNSVLVGDATTGEIYYRYQSDMSYPIASTSKLMTCLLTMDAIAAGKIRVDDLATVSDEVQSLAASGDGVIPLKAGEQISVEELLVGTLLPSSNECALCLAELIAGSEEAFVGMMNQKAQELGLSQTIFYNSNGLPVYTEDFIPAKRQNRMSAEDMFRLVSYLLKVYPQVTDITSMEEATLESQGLEVRNSNPLLYNLPEVTGLKTGTTNKAGACLVTSLTVDDGVAEHDMVVVVLGTEDSIERGRVSGVLARYAMHLFDTETGETDDMGETGKLPIHAEAAVDQIIRTARKR